MLNVLKFHSPSATSVTAFTSCYTLQAWNFPPSVDLIFMCAVRLSGRSPDQESLRYKLEGTSTWCPLKVTKSHTCGILWNKSLQNSVGWEARSASTVEITPLSVHGSEFPVNQKGIQPLHWSSNHRAEPQRPGWASGGGTQPWDLANDRRVWRQ